MLGVLGEMDQKYLKTTQTYFSGKVQVKTKSITGLKDTKDGARNTQHFQNSDDKDDMRNILTYRNLRPINMMVKVI